LAVLLEPREASIGGYQNRGTLADHWYLVLLHVGDDTCDDNMNLLTDEP
jgi:hypothetical protein